MCDIFVVKIVIISLRDVARRHELKIVDRVGEEGGRLIYRRKEPGRSVSIRRPSAGHSSPMSHATLIYGCAAGFNTVRNLSQGYYVNNYYGSASYIIWKVTNRIRRSPSVSSYTSHTYLPHGEVKRLAGSVIDRTV